MKAITHPQKRAMQRYGVQFTRAEVERIAGKIPQAAEFVRRDEDGEIWDVSHGDRVFRVAFDPSIGRIRTFLPDPAALRHQSDGVCRSSLRRKVYLHRDGAAASMRLGRSAAVPVFASDDDARRFCAALGIEAELGLIENQRDFLGRLPEGVRIIVGPTVCDRGRLLRYRKWESKQ